MTPMEPAIALNISIAAVLVGLTGYAVYTAFGPPSKALDDPFEDHED
jgi:PsbN protein